uniref:RNA-directed DNA polymerase n=2 Tax=Trichuris muris TaxID=70415 RepID=A0A5S6R3L9_TRIMR
MDAVKKEIDRLTESGIWIPVKSSVWAAPIVIVPKSTGSIRICGDFKLSVNSQLEVEHYPIPRIEEIFHKLGKGQTFTKIDLADAYLQIELDDESKIFMVVNTPFGLYQYQRLPFGVASAPSIFQRFMDQLVSDIPGCVAYLDDIIVTGANESEHLNNLDSLLRRLEENGLRCRVQKCKFFQREVEYLGHVLSANGLCPSETRVQAIKALPRPRNLQELQAFIGKVNYYGKFINNLASLCAPFRPLRKKHAVFKWHSDQEEAFQRLKDELVHVTKLVHFREDYPLILASDASAYGIGAVLMHRYPDGSERPIAHASKTLTEQQRGYSQIEREALSIIYAVNKFHQYVYGRHFELVTDHKPLVSIFHPKRKLPVMTAQRLQRWAITLMAYTFTIRYKPTAEHGNADGLSRLPAGPDFEFDSQVDLCNTIQVNADDGLPMQAFQLAKATAQDVELNRVYRYMRRGWPEELSSSEEVLRPYCIRRHMLTSDQGVILLDSDCRRVVVPLGARKYVLSRLHEGHWGVVRMKQLARRYC